MKKHLLPFFILMAILLSKPSQAQKFDYDLSNYKTPDYKRSSLELDADLGQAFSGRLEYPDTLDFENRSKGFGVNSPFELKYNRIDFTRKKIINDYFNLENKFNFNSSSYVGKELTEYQNSSMSYEIGPYIGLNRSVKNYYKQNSNCFLKYSGGAFFNYSKNKSTNKNVTILDSHAYSAQIAFSLNHGHGRLENIENAVEAIYILKELNSLKLLINEPDEKMVNLLADKITQLEEKRFFDSRLYKREFFTELIRFMLKQNMIKDDSLDLFMAINDFHFLAGINERQAGSQISYGISPRVYTRLLDRKKYSEEDYFIHYLQSSVDFNISYINKTPLNFKWQREWKAELASHLQNYRHKENGQWQDTDRNYFNGSTRIEYALSYYPNTRTYFRSSISGLYRFQFQEIDENEYYSYPINQVGLYYKLYTYYYIAEKLRLSGEFNLSGDYMNRDQYYFNDDDTANMVNSNKFNFINLST